MYRESTARNSTGRNVPESERVRVLKEHNSKITKQNWQTVDEHNQEEFEKDENPFDSGKYYSKKSVDLEKLKTNHFRGYSQHVVKNVQLHSHESYGSGGTFGQNNNFYEDRLPSKVLHVELLEEDTYQRTGNGNRRRK